MHEKDELTPREKKYKWCERILALTMIVLFMRLFDLQILKGDEMRRLSEQNRVRVKKILAPEGDHLRQDGQGTGRHAPVVQPLPHPGGHQGLYPDGGRLRAASGDRPGRDHREAEGRARLPFVLPRQDRVRHVDGPGGEGRGQQVLPAGRHDPDRAEAQLSVRPHALPRPRIRVGGQPGGAEDGGIQKVRHRGHDRQVRPWRGCTRSICGAWTASKGSRWTPPARR